MVGHTVLFTWTRKIMMDFAQMIRLMKILNQSFTVNFRPQQKKGNCRDEPIMSHITLLKIADDQFAQNLGEFTVSITVSSWLRFILATIDVLFSLHGGTYSAIYLDTKAVINHGGHRINNPIVEHSQS